MELVKFNRLRRPTVARLYNRSLNGALYQKAAISLGRDSLFDMRQKPKTKLLN